MEEKKIGIDCSIFLGEEQAMERLTKEINEARSIEVRAAKAQVLIDEAEVLLACDRYNANSMDCRNCRTITDMRKSTAEMIKKTQRLA